MEFEDELVVLLRLGVVLLLHSIDAAEPEEGPEGAASREPLRYRAPVAYERQNWSLGEAGWGDSECLAYLRFSRAEIQSLIEEFKLAEVWVDSERDHNSKQTIGRLEFLGIAKNCQIA
ncbi:hypothetical protein EV426DRAFT_641117 [Tirmania nivea]|nr:hypothetical protein EV426DRAFT_641117 [Tirmania nivea]